MNVIKSLTLLSFIGFVVLWILVGFSFELFSSFVFILLITMFFCSGRKAPVNDDQKEDETNEEYEQRKKTEEFQRQIAENNDYANNQDFQLLITDYGVLNTQKIFKALHDKKIWTDQSPSVVYQTIQPLVQQCGKEKASDIVFFLLDKGLWTMDNPFFVSDAVLPLIQTCGDWDTAKDVLLTSYEGKILTTDNSRDLINNAVIPLMKLCGSWSKAKEILFTYHEKGVLQNSDFSLVKVVVPLIEKYGWKKVKEISLILFEVNVWNQKKPNFLNDVVFPLLETEKTKDVLIALTAFEQSNIYIDSDIVPRVRSNGLTDVTTILVTLAENHISNDANFAFHTVFPMISSVGWDTTQDILITLRNAGFDPTSHAKLLKNTLPNLIESNSWEQIKESIESLKSEGFNINEDSFEIITNLLTRYEPSQLGYVLTNIKENNLFVGAHKIEVRAMMGEPYYIKSGGRTEDWCYEPSKNAKKFGKRIKFRGDYVYDFRI